MYPSVKVNLRNYIINNRKRIRNQREKNTKLNYSLNNTPTKKHIDLSIY